MELIRDNQGPAEQTQRLRTVRFICKRCGQPGETTYPETGIAGLDQYLYELATMLNHNRCVPEPKPLRMRQMPLAEVRIPHKND